MKNNFLNIAMPKFGFVHLLIENPIYITTVLPTVAIVKIVDYIEVWKILLTLTVIDLFTGIVASYFEWKKGGFEGGFFSGNGEGFSSDKAKKMGVKFAIYLIVPQLAVGLQRSLHLKTISYPSVSDAEFELASILVLFFCMIEGFSIFRENLPKCGIDIWGSVKKMIGFVNEIKTEIKK